MKTILLFVSLLLISSCVKYVETKDYDSQTTVTKYEIYPVDTNNFEVKLDTLKYHIMKEIQQSDSSCDQWNKDSLFAATQGYYGC